MRIIDVTHVLENAVSRAGTEGKSDSVPYRLEDKLDNIIIKTDVHDSLQSSLMYLRISGSDQPSVVRLSTGCSIERTASTASGLIVQLLCADKRCLLWFPAAPVWSQLDKQSRIRPLPEEHYFWNLNDGVELGLPVIQQSQDVLVPLLVTVADVEAAFDALTKLSECESRLYLKSEWFSAKHPGDLWRYLINGSIYDPRSCPPVEKRFKCQQCGYAWWTYFDYIHDQTKKKLWRVLRDEIALCAAEDMEKTGAWRNGFWSDSMEIHSRFQLDGLHLLISQYERTGSRRWLDAAGRGMAFVEEHLAETLDDGSLWFLHDDVHVSKRHKIRSRAFGKSEGNSLCLNTHVQALTVIHRLSSHSDNESHPYEEMFEGGITALERIMGHQPAEVLYRYFVPRILKMGRDTGKSTVTMIKRRLERRVLLKSYWRVRARYPRLVQPNGFIERDLTVEVGSHRYHVTNLKDLLTLYLQRPLPWLRSHIEHGYAFLVKYIKEVGIEKAVSLSPYFIEVAEIMYMYNKAVSPVSEQDLSDVIEGIMRQTNGCSLDYHASGLVHV